MTSPSPKRPRAGSLKSILDANSHHGVISATGEAIARGPSLKELRRNSVGSGGRRGSSVSAGAVRDIEVRAVAIDEEEAGRKSRDLPLVDGVRGVPEPSEEGSSDGDGGGCWAVTVGGLRAFWSFFITPSGFFITIYLLNVIAWGGMLFLLLCNASPAMCRPTCDDIDSPRRIWIEIDSQILNALFCVTGFGLAPWRFRDLYFLLRWRLAGDKPALHKLEVIHAGWFRGPDSAELIATTTGTIAPRTKSWKMDYVVWLYVWNTFFQCGLSGFMWGMNRYNRPPWSTGLFVCLAFLVAGMAGGQVWWETKRVKKIEGERIVPKVEVEGGTRDKVKDKGRRFWAREERDVIRANRST